MSKTTVVLLIIFATFVSVLLFAQFGLKHNQIISPFTPSAVPSTDNGKTTLTLSSASQFIQPGHTVTVSVLIHAANPQTDIVQFELSYDPTAITVDSITPGTFFTNPNVILQTIDQVAGRLSYALKCSETGPANQTNCTTRSSSTVAIITMHVNSYITSASTKLAFLPKTVIRTRGGKDLLQYTSGLQLAITKPYFPISSFSATASQSVHIH